MEDLNLFSLPKEILAIIINLVGTEHLLRSESTSKLWQTLFWDSLLTLDIFPKKKAEFKDANFERLLKKTNPLKLRKIVINGDKTLTEQTLPQLSAYNNIIAFSCRSLSQSAIRAVIPALTNVRRLDLSSRGLSDSCITLLASHMPFLTKLLLGNSSDLKALPDITRLTKLEVLNLAFSDKVENQGMLEICQMTHLKKLDVCWLRNITGEAFEKVSKLTKLIHLDISNVAGVAVGYLTALLTLTNLELLDTSYYKLLTDFGLSIIGKLTKMTRLVFVDHRMVTSDGFNFLTDLRHLNHLSLSAMPNIANDHFYSALTNLTYLSVKMTSERNFSVLGHLTKMKDIHIHTTDVDLGFFLFCSAMPDLARINLRAARCSIEVDMLTHCTDLTSLELEDCASYYGTDSNNIIDNVLLLTTLNYLGLRLDRDFNRLAALTKLETLMLHVPQATLGLKVADFGELLTLPELNSLNLTAPLPENELKEMFSANKKLTHLVIESNSNSHDAGYDPWE